MRESLPVEARVYRAALRMYPPAFRREFSAEMLHVFGEARADAVDTAAPGARWAFWREMAADLARSLLVQWIRTGWPAIVVLAITASVATVAALVSLWPRQPLVLATGTPHADTIAVEFVVLAALLVVGMTIAITLWSARFVRRTRRG